jgi:hypothetical protein
MTNACTCGHVKADHHGGLGRCGGLNTNPRLTLPYCYCRRFSRGSKERSTPVTVVRPSCAEWTIRDGKLVSPDRETRLEFSGDEIAIRSPELGLESIRVPEKLMRRWMATRSAFGTTPLPRARSRKVR